MTTPLKVLIIEDEATPGATVKNRLDEIEPKLLTEVHSFENALDRVSAFQPDAIVLDLIEGQIDTGVMAGNITWQNVWSVRFVPLIVYTASTTETTPPLPADHPFVVRIRKGSTNSILEVETKMKEFLPYMQAVREASTSLSTSFHRVLSVSAPAIWKGTSDAEIRKEILSRVMRRRVAASADLALLDSAPELVHWEQYIYPPLESDLLTGDILRTVGGDWRDAKQYKIVLTPSCDLVRRDGTCRCPMVLAAACVDGAALWDKWSLPAPSTPTAEEKATTKLSTMLTDSRENAGLLALPPFPTVLPVMAIDLKSLSLIDYSTVRGFQGEHPTVEPAYERIVSVDSPFREAIAWAHIQTASRPGLPSRDLQSWIQELVAAQKASTNTQNQ